MHIWKGAVQQNRLYECRRKEEEMHPAGYHWNAKVLSDLLWSDRKHSETGE